MTSLLVLYASQTGNAEWIAKNIEQESRKKGFVDVSCMTCDAYAEASAIELMNGY
jgi:methionine synthase reductase